MTQILGHKGAVDARPPETDHYALLQSTLSWTGSRQLVNYFLHVYFASISGDKSVVYPCICCQETGKTYLKFTAQSKQSPVAKKNKPKQLLAVIKMPKKTTAHKQTETSNWINKYCFNVFHSQWLFLVCWKCNSLDESSEGNNHWPKAKRCEFELHLPQEVELEWQEGEFTEL